MSGKLEVPTFNNRLEDYKEFRKRCLLYKARMKLEGKIKQVGLAVLGQLTGIAWTACEQLADDPEALETDTALDEILVILDRRFQYEKITDLPEAFEEYFYKGNRKPRETMFEYINRVRLSTDKVAKYKVVLPDEIQGWLLMRRAGLTEEQKTLVMTQVGTDLKFEKIAKVLQTTFGQTQVMKSTGRHEKTYYEEDYQEDERWEEPPEYEDTYYGETYQDQTEYEPEWEDEAAEDWYDAEEAEEGYHYDGDYQEAEFDPDEYDNIYTNYLDARKKFAELRTARGFYPVVAVIPDNAPGGKSRGKGKGKGKGPKGS